MKLIYEIFRWKGLLLAWPLHALFFKRKTYSENKAEQSRWLKGGALVISNHFHTFDYFLNATLFPFRKLGVVIAEFAWQRKFIIFGMKCCGGIKSDRDAMSMRFIDESVEVLERGGLVQIFPEAYFSEDGLMHDFKPSYLLIALRADVPIVPVMPQIFGACRLCVQKYAVLAEDFRENFEKSYAELKGGLAIC